MIATYMRAQAGLNEKLFLEFDLVQSLRYGENPHQSAKFYREEHEVPYSLAFARQLNGKELSYNNIQDANAALCIVREFSEPFCVGLKHMNPAGLPRARMSSRRGPRPTRPTRSRSSGASSPRTAR